MTHKEFYIWLEGYLHGKLESEQIEIGPIVKKMGEVKESNQPGIFDPNRIPIPINPIINPNGTDPYRPPYEVYCGPKDILND
jgi:hypothetical protein